MRPSPLKLLRLCRGLTQATVAEALGVDQTAISLLERGRLLSGPTLPKLAAYYDRSPETLRRRMLRWRREIAAPPLAAEDRRVA